ncbi:ABC transporter ATP-binding protein [Neosynechococcus sphagnicola sy1]|uniref:ABC transporter ATP-binding protein n=1 Tax=Neosynechococcus sphagnicola sy1 TaxID=1497020 RepID=A0A098TKT3_9CYAN|nr:FHA domain-containing protein [Neosynechococcus sphagnicola]KGF72899.1 ABC transporter ATP-binding protein [Neosynechococcus sphagnicola sy1]
MTASPARLEVIKNIGRQEFLIEQDTVSIGRAPDNHLILNDPTISRYHAQIDRGSEGYFITDLDSAIGTKVNEFQLTAKTAQALSNGDLIQIGTFTLCFRTNQQITPHATLSYGLATTAPVLRIITDQWFQDFSLNRETLLLGSHPTCDIVIHDPAVVACHARLVRQADNRFTIINLSTPEALTDQGRPVDQRDLQAGDSLRITPSLSLSYRGVQPIEEMALEKVWLPRLPVTQLEGYEPETMALTSLTELGISLPPDNLSLSGRNSLSIGRDPRNDMVISHPTVSRFHAKVERQNGSFVLNDLGSSNGTYVNGKEVMSPVVLRTGDTIRIGCDRLVLNIDESFTQHVEEGNLRLDALNLCKVVGKGTQILNHVSLSILPREFVAILGPSGSGKSTLLDALNGLRPASSGAVLVNSMDLYKNYHAYHAQLGYVPQKNIIHEELTIAQALEFAAQLRMPPDTTPEERRQRIQVVLAELGLSHRQQVPIKLLSGGQQRRVCIGVELLTKPSLFFLDEATSGLDPGTEADMMSLLRQLADQGRTILIITHATQNIRECDLVIYMAEGGRVAYFGPPEQMLDYFRDNFREQFQGMKLQDFSGIYRALDIEKNPNAPSAEELQQKYCQSHLYQQYVVQRQQGIVLDDSRKNSRTRPKFPPQSRQRVSAWQQFLILSGRNLAILLQDRTNLLLTLAIAPLLAMLDFFTWKSNLFDATHGSAAQALTMLFVTALVAVMVGAMTTMRELIKEVEVYRRERMIGLQVLPYVLSKVWIGALLAIYQGGAYLLVIKLAVNLPGGLEVTWQMYVTLVLAIFGGMVTGLLVSAIAPNQNVAPLLILMFLIPQIIFSGGIQPIGSFGLPGQVINNLTVIKWPFETLVTLSGLGQGVAKDACWQKTEAERDQLTDAQLSQCHCFGSQVFKVCDFPGIKAKYDPAVDLPQPVKPTPPGEMPFDPILALQYQSQVDAYQKAMETWQTNYLDWQQKRSKSINEAEGLINRFNKDQGYMFNVNVVQHWRNLGLLILGMLVVIPLLQKRKDFV